ncbi:MAG: hypothetical protein H0W84_06540, partial [Bacteroidetes bacterium]|nr:hypothetical protein [Bacteroidota bacterium]
MRKTFRSQTVFYMLVLILFTGSLVNAQQGKASHTTTDTSMFALYRAQPVWKDMMADSNANYFEVQK